MENDKELKQVKEIVVTNNKKEAIDCLNLTDQSLEEIDYMLNLLKNAAVRIRNNLLPGVDFYVLPGQKKQNLSKSGAQKIALMFGLRFKIKSKEIIKINNIECFQIIVQLFNNKDMFISDGIGHATVMKQQNQTPDWNYNASAKIAEKRAMIDAVIKIANLSEVFTQDMEDFTATARKVLTIDQKKPLYALCSEWAISENKKAAIRGDIPKFTDFELKKYGGTVWRSFNENFKNWNSELPIDKRLNTIYDLCKNEGLFNEFKKSLNLFQEK